MLMAIAIALEVASHLVDSSKMRFLRELWPTHCRPQCSCRTYGAAQQASRLCAPPQMSGDVTGNLQEVFRKAALEQLKARVQGSLTRANVAATADMDRLLEQQAELTQRDREVSAGVDSVQVSPACMPCAAEQCREGTPLGSPCQRAFLMLLLCVRVASLLLPARCSVLCCAGGEACFGGLCAGDGWQVSSAGAVAG